MPIRYGTIGRQTLYYITLFFFAFFFYIIRTHAHTRARILLLLYCFILLRFLLLLLLYLLLHYTLFLYTHSTKQNRTKTKHLWLLIPLTHIYPPKHFLSLLFLHRSAFSPCLSTAPKFKICQSHFAYYFHNYYYLIIKHFSNSDFTC